MENNNGRHRGKVALAYRATEQQRQKVRTILPETPIKEIEAMGASAASRIIAWHVNQWRDYPATPRQERFLRECNQWQDGMLRGEASQRIIPLKKRLAKPTADQISQEIDQARHQQADLPG